MGESKLEITKMSVKKFKMEVFGIVKSKNGYIDEELVIEEFLLLDNSKVSVDMFVLKIEGSELEPILSDKTEIFISTSYRMLKELIDTIIVVEIDGYKFLKKLKNINGNLELHNLNDLGERIAVDINNFYPVGSVEFMTKSYI